MRGQSQMNIGNGYYDQNMNRVSISNVQQVNDRAFYQQGTRWIDSRLVGDEKSMKPTETVEFGSDEFKALVARLAKENRAGSVSLKGEILLDVDGKSVLIKAPAGEK